MCSLRYNKPMGNKNSDFDWVAPCYERIFRIPPSGEIKHWLKLPFKGWLLDVGGGTGRVAAGLVGTVEGIVVLDASIGMLRQARRKPGLFPVWGMAECLPFQTGKFTRVLMVDAFHHLKDQEAVLGELMRVLAPGGVLLIEEPDYHHWAVKVVALFERCIGMRSRFWYPEDIAARIKAMGYIPEIHKHGTTLRILVVK